MRMGLGMNHSLSPYQMVIGWGIKISPYNEDIASYEFVEQHFTEVREQTPFKLVDISHNYDGENKGILVMLREGLIQDSPQDLDCFMTSFPVLSSFGEGIDESLDVVRQFAFLVHEDWRVYAGQSIF